LAVRRGIVRSPEVEAVRVKVAHDIDALGGERARQASRVLGGEDLAFSISIHRGALLRIPFQGTAA
jgi:hypothetical protein